MSRSSTRTDRTRTGRLPVILCGLALMGMAAMAAPAASAVEGKPVRSATGSPIIPLSRINSPGPLFEIILGADLSSQIGHTTDGARYEIFPPDPELADYGTFLAVAGTLYAPDFARHFTSATSNLGAYIPLTRVSQSAVTGSGTAADPYQVVTVADVGASGLRITQTDSYIVGQESYRTDLTVNNTGTSTVDAVLYRALDCYLGGMDMGYGFVTGTAVGCAENPGNNPPGRIEMLVPITGGNNFLETVFAGIWSAIATQAPFNDSCECSARLDNGIGISWAISVAAGGSVTRSHRTVFSPGGNVGTPIPTVSTWGIAALLLGLVGAAVRRLRATRRA